MVGDADEQRATPRGGSSGDEDAGGGEVCCLCCCSSLVWRKEALLDVGEADATRARETTEPFCEPACV